MRMTPTSQRQRHRERLILRRAGGRHQHQATGEDRRDGGIGAAGQEAVAAEHGKADRSRDEGEEADLRREAAEPGGRHLLGDRDRRQRQARDQVARQVAQPERGQRAEDRPVGFLGTVCGNIRWHRSRALCAEEYPCEYSDIARPKASDAAGVDCAAVMALRIAASGAVSSNSTLSPCGLRPRSRQSAARSGVHGFGPHLVVKPRQHVDADGLVGGRENALERPVLFVIAAGGDHAAHRVLQAEAIVGRVCGFRYRRAGRTSRRPNICAPRCRCCRGPGRRLAAGPCGMSRIIACQISCRREIAGLHPRDRLDIDGQSFRQPGVALVQIGQGEYAPSRAPSPSRAARTSSVESRPSGMRMAAPR